MIVPNNGRVVVIDDNIEEEAIPLIKALGKAGIAVRFYTGRPTELPSRPLNGIRLLFLDIKLAGMEFTNDTEDLINSLRPVLSRTLDKANGPYILIGWTKHPEHLNTLCASLVPKPALWIDLEKSRCITDGVCDLPKISRALRQKLQDLQAFQLLFQWEASVNQAAYETVNDFRALFEENADPNRALCNLLHKLAEANLGKQINRTHIQAIIANALLTLSGPLIDKLEASVGRPSSYRNTNIRFPVPGAQALEATTTSRINARLHIAKDTIIDAQPGNIYRPINKSLRTMTKEVIGGALKGVDETSSKVIKRVAKGCILEISATCDHAQAKWKRHRIIPGAFIPAEHVNKLKRSDALFITPSFTSAYGFKGCFKLIFDFSYFTSIGFRSLRLRRPVFRLRKDLLVEIQTRLARHINRPGILEL